MISNTPTATNTAINSTSPMIAATDVGLYLCLGRGAGSPSPEVCAESGGVAPGATPPPGSRSGVSAGSGSGGSAVMS